LRICDCAALRNALDGRHSDPERSGDPSAACFRARFDNLHGGRDIAVTCQTIGGCEPMSFKPACSSGPLSRNLLDAF
jgi:hypothetical protein